MAPGYNSCLQESDIKIRCSRQFRDELHRIAQSRETTLSGLVRQIAIEHLPLQLNK
ncbi:hypothetical protein N9997_01290 [Synechococcus sp. AH-603-L18]|nr:hypothetical protein [Synechococcus sp. AH-603-L18]MDB4337956.1 hypothetical protein [Synechococcus sp. AH-603-L18]